MRKMQCGESFYEKIPTFEYKIYRNMKRFLFACAFTLLLCNVSYGWGVREHAAVAQIAEQHLTPEAKQLIADYLKRRPMAYYACDADINRRTMYVDSGDKTGVAPKTVRFPHTFNVDKSFKPYRGVADKSGVFRKNMLYYVEQIAKDLKANHRTMNDSVRLVHLSLLIHAVGDMHCPMHVVFEDKPSYGVYDIYFGKGKKKDKMTYHKVWDSKLVGTIHPWSYTEIAELLDIYNAKEIAKFSKGDIYAWGKEVAKVAYPACEYGPGARIEEVEFRKKYQQTAELLVAKAGYRLAKLLNDILK